MMEMMVVNKENIEHEHICCALSSNQDIQVISKKKWMIEQFDNGLVFMKMNVRGKCFIEYMPLENAWVPIIGNDLMYIQCLWVSGKFQGKGYAKALLEFCKKDCLDKGKKGLVMVSSLKKTGFLMDYQFLKKCGFYSVDTWEKEYVLMFYPLQENVQEPHIQVSPIEDDGPVLYYTDQCPFNAKYVPILKDYCDKQGIILKCHHIQTLEAAKKAPTLFTTYSLFYQKTFLTREVLNVRKFEKVWKNIYE